MKKIDFYREIAKLDKIEKNSLRLEQYSTDIDTAYQFINFVDYNISITGKTVADLGCGNGILGISAALLGAAEVDLYDIDENAVYSAKQNIEKLHINNAKSIRMDIFDVDKKYEIVISNPPFGFQSNFSLSAFIKKINSLADNLFFIYKDNLEIRKIADSNGFLIHKIEDIKLERTLPFHKKSYYSLPVVIVYKTTNKI
ncbi:MAG: methyltransferase [Candidatus Parvarchaeota archaeon]|nr:methyltransferase [Candidatus Parvarchaeum tengchongense]MCW1299342.1 methyltransferase [Candidatus Parvarchaeum tengchongense]MCW1312579.1 methyltransferase [Candidatus Parvarchaeum tengchongense]